MTINMGSGTSTDRDQSKKVDRPERAQTESRYVMITGVGNMESKDILRKRLENAINRQNPVDKIVYGSILDKVVVIFRDPVNPKFLESLLEKQSLQYKFETIKEPTVVQVLDIAPGIDTLHAVKLYLTNKEQSGGIKEADFYGNPDTTCGYCLIDLKRPEVVHRVSERTHVISGYEIRILPFYTHLGIAVNLEERPECLITDKLVLKGMDTEILKFIYEKMEIQFWSFTKTYRIILADQNLNSLTFCPNLNETSSASDKAAVVFEPDWKARVEKAFSGEFLDQLHVERLEIKGKRQWRYIQVMKEELCRETPEVNLYEDSSPFTFKFVCRKTDEQVLRSLKVKIESIEPPEEFVTDIVDGYSSIKLRVFEVLGLKDDIEYKTQVELRMVVTDGKIELTGFKMNIQVAKTEIAQILESLEEKICSPPNKDYLEILKSPQLIEQCNREIEKKNLRGIWEIISEGVSQKVLICYEDIQKDTFKQIKDLIFGVLLTDIIVINGNMHHESLVRLRTEIIDIETSLVPFARITLLEYSNNVKITCRKDLMVRCKHKLQKFINVNLICTSEISMKAAIANYIYDVMKSQIEHDLSEACGKSLDWNFKDSKFYITGNQIVISKCTEVLYKLASKVIVTWRPIERKGIHKYFASGAGSTMESQLNRCHLKILGKDDFQKQKIRAIALTEEGQAIGIGDLDLYKQHVDAVVNEMNEDFEQFSRGGEELEREISDYIKSNGKLTEGQVFISGPGKLPCLKIMHAVAPKWRGGAENVDKTLEKIIQKILCTAKSESLRSIAMPILACRSLFGYPTKRASGILLQTIIKHWPTRFKSVREIYICDTDSTRIQTFQRLAENMFRSQCFSIPMGQNLTFGKTIAQKPIKKLKEGFQTIVQRRGIRKIPLPAGLKIIIAWGDLAKLLDCTPPLKADIIVNPTTSFPDLSGDIAKGLKAATSNGGMFDLESECKKKEPQGGLQTGSYVATKTPHMSCDQILHLRIEGDWSKINEEILKGYIKSCVKYALLKDKTSIAFPTIGTGSKGYPRDVVARCFVHAISEFSQAQTSGSLKKVIIVIYHRDSDTTLAFERELQRLLAKRPHRVVANTDEEIMEEEQKEKKKKKGKISCSSYSDNPLPVSPILLETYPLQNGCSVTLKHGSLEDSGAVSLVSSTSRVPKLNGVIPSAIKKAAGGTIIEDELQKKYGKGIKVGEIAITGAGNIRGCNKIYHLQLEDYNSQKGSQASLIYNSVNKCLRQADKDGVSSVAFPTIGTGGFKWPPQLVADETFQAVKSYTNSRRSSGPPLHIIIMIFSQNSPENMVFQTTAKNQLGQGGSSPKHFGPIASSDDDQAATATYLKMKVDLIPGKLEESKADVIVSTTSSFPELNGVIAKALSNVAGPNLQADCSKNYPKGLQDGQVASTSVGNLNCKKVFHIKLSEWNHSNGKSVVEGTVTECLKMLQSEGFHSIAFPTIGTGELKYPAKDVASAMFETAKQFCQNNPGYNFQITIVLFPPAKDVNQVFKDSLSQTFQNVQQDATGEKKGVSFADIPDVDDDETVFSETPTNIDHEKRDFVLLKLISDSVDQTNKVFQAIRKQVDHDFLGHEPLKNDVIGKLRLSDIQEIEMICRKLDVEVEILKLTNEITFAGTSGNVRSANEQILKVLTTLNESLQSETVGKLVQQYYEWCYEETKHLLIPYSKKLGIELEIAFTKGVKTYEFTDTDDLKYCVDFSKYVEFEESNSSNTVKVVRLDRMMGDLQPLPDIWNQKDKVNLEVVTLQTTDKEYSDVETNFKSTIGSFKLTMIHSIKRIQNRTIYQQYALKRRFMQNQYPNLQSVEMTLWHGTALDNVNKINLNGFNRSYAGQTFGKVWYGKGVYFSTQSKYGCDDNYTKKDAKLRKYIYQCKVLTGNSTVVAKGYLERYPPTDPATGTKYDSTSSPNMDEYVIYSDTQSYPEYLIEFE